jgi:hypothetical protein
MTKKAIINQADLMRMAAVAKKTGMRVEVEIDGVIVRVAPDISTDRTLHDFTSLTEWQAWRDQERAREKQNTVKKERIRL